MSVKVIKYDMKNINTDLIIPARYLVTSNPSILGKHCLEDLDPEFSTKVKEFGYNALVTNSNFGCGSSREQAAASLKAAGIKYVIAPSFARIFFRNAINTGLAIITFEHIEKIKTDDTLEIDIKNGTIMNQTSNSNYNIDKFAPFLQSIINVEGLVNYVKNFVRGEKEK